VLLKRKHQLNELLKRKHQLNKIVYVIYIVVVWQGKQGGRIGITVQSRWYEPFRNTPTDILAVERALSFGALW
jgi:hypothetical protein